MAPLLPNTFRLIPSLLGRVHYEVAPEAWRGTFSRVDQGRCLERLVDLRNDLGWVRNLHDQPIVGFVFEVDHDGLVSMTVHVVEPDPRQVDTGYSPSPPQRMLDLRVCFDALHVL